jgi:peroxidase
MQSGGKPYYVPLGRLDALRTAAWSYVHDLPHFTADLSRVINLFKSRKFFDEIDVVALSGAHSIGKAHCSTFAHRFSKEDSDFVQKLRDNCTADVDRLQELDVNTPNTLDNVYYMNIKNGTGVLATDQLLNGDDRTQWLVDGFAEDEWWFWNQFGNSMTKMGMLQGYHGNVGEVRRVSCSQRNPDSSA